MTDLPRPDVNASITNDCGKTKVSVTIKRESAERTYEAEHSLTTESVKDVVKQIISDPVTAEWLPGGKSSLEAPNWSQEETKKFRDEWNRLMKVGIRTPDEVREELGYFYP